MFAMSTYHVLNIMIFLSLNYDKKSVSLKEITAFCMLPVKIANSLLDKLQKHGLILEENEKKLKRCRLSEWAVMRGCDLYSF